MSDEDLAYQLIRAIKKKDKDLFSSLLVNKMSEEEALKLYRQHYASWHKD
jgi:hypothetical protein